MNLNNKEIVLKKVKSGFASVAPYVGAGLVLFGLSEVASADATIDAMMSSVKPMMTALTGLITEYGGYILAALGILTVIAILRKLL